MGIVFNSVWEECFHRVSLLLSGDGPCFLGRIGGSDTNAVLAYFDAKRSDRPEDAVSRCIEKHLPIVKRYNGYYDKSNSTENFLSYIGLLSSIYHSCSELIVCNANMLSVVFENNIHPNFLVDNPSERMTILGYFDSMARGGASISCYPYSFVEKLVFDKFTLFRSFSSVLEGKKVLVISPFAKSIQGNFHNRHGIFKGQYKYPEFELITYNVPITYDGLPQEYYPHENWFETATAMQADIAKIDFDIALLACGSYAMPIGKFIEKSLNKKAVYVGGVLQLYFGIIGRRYENEYFKNQMNFESCMYPLEKDEFLAHAKITDKTAREAFGAYF